MSSVWIRVSYSVLLAILLALTAGFAVTMVVAGPRPPDTPSLSFRVLQSESDSPQQTDALIGTVDCFFQDSYSFRRDYPNYQRDVLIGAVLLATVAGAIGIVLSPAFNVLRLGLTLGAILLLLWGSAFVLAPVPNPAPSDSSSVTNLLAAGLPALDLAGRFLRFGASFIALLVFLFLGLWRLTEWPGATQAATGSVPSRQPEGAVAAAGHPPTGESAAWLRPDDRCPPAPQ